MTDRPEYKGAPLDPARGPGLGCFRFQVVLLAVLLVLTPIGVVNAWPGWLTTLLLAGVLVLTLFAGQTVIFLLRLVSADRRSRRRPMREGARPTVGDLTTGAPGEEDDPPGSTPGG
ncbi:MAG: hypothetical protein ACRDF7_02240 [Candidatus Limnocylindrales bacterium]